MNLSDAILRTMQDAAQPDYDGHPQPEWMRARWEADDAGRRAWQRVTFADVAVSESEAWQVGASVEPRVPWSADAMPLPMDWTTVWIHVVYAHGLVAATFDKPWEAMSYALTLARAGWQDVHTDRVRLNQLQRVTLGNDQPDDLRRCELCNVSDDTRTLSETQSGGWLCSECIDA